ncbi:hypothetical protein PM082_003773 [Marasmius tenuissimus]|nr:hypothetical protein PM082_003773 [Marasmius tenuissimus]
MVSTLVMVPLRLVWASTWSSLPPPAKTQILSSSPPLGSFPCYPHHHFRHQNQASSREIYPTGPPPPEPGSVAGTRLRFANRRNGSVGGRLNGSMYHVDIEVEGGNH